jgi:hypothetical protein
VTETAAPVIDEILRLLEASRRELEATQKRVLEMHANVSAIPPDQRDEWLSARRVEIVRAINEPWLQALELMAGRDPLEIERDGRIPALMQSIWNMGAEAQIWQDIVSAPDRRPDVPSAFLSGRAPIPSSITVQAALASYRDGEGWHNGGENLPTFVYRQKQGGVTLFLRPPDDTAPTQALVETLWNQVSRLGDTDGDVLLAMMAQAMEPGRQGGDGGTWITASAILDYRGVQPIKKREGRAIRRAGHRVEDLAEVAACIERLTYQWVELRDVEYLEEHPGKKPKRSRLTHESRLLTIDERLMQGELGGDRRPVAWRYQLGRCIRDYLKRPNRQVAQLMQRVLQYDPYHERWEKRLAIYFTIHHRISASYKTPLRREVGGLLKELRLPINARDPSKTLRRFEHAMGRLSEDGIIPSWRYTDRAKIDRLPARGWLTDWLACVVEVPPARRALAEAGKA